MTSSVSGLHGIEHVGLTVPDIDSATDFFVSLLGAEELYRLGPVSAGDHWMAVNLGVDAEAEIRAVSTLAIGGGGALLELLEYDAPEQTTRAPTSSDAGGHHVAFRVDDIESATDAIRAYGCLVLGEAKTVSEGPLAGLRWCYFLAPWGLMLELVSYPAGLPVRAGREPVAGRAGRTLGEPDPDPA